MIKSISCLVIICFVQIVNAQDAYKKRYFVKDTIKYTEKYYDERKQRTKNKEVFLTLKTEHADKEVNDTIIKIAGSRGLKSNIIFGEKNESHKLFINPWLVNSEGGYIDRDSVYYYELKNRRSVKIRFKQWSFNALSVPLKVRFGEDKTEFSTGINLGALLGHTWGKTNFLHRKKIGNKQYDSQHTLGGFVGANKLDFSFEDEDGSEEDVTTASISLGLGYMYAYQKFTFGLTGGFDFGLGENSTEWDYQSKPWLGIAVGYSLFSF
ncbi:MAG: hypothetical protein WD048_13260 [Chitinophagales bacterium]